MFLSSDLMNEFSAYNEINCEKSVSRYMQNEIPYFAEN